MRPVQSENPMHGGTAAETDTQAILENERNYVLRPWAVQRLAENPLVVKRAQGRHFWDAGGKRFLDFSSQLTNVNVAHQHPKIVAAIEKQARTLCYASPSCVTAPRGTLGRMLAEIAPAGLNKSMVVTSGAAANDAALKIVRAWTGRQKTIGRYRSYHGGSYGAGAIGGDPRRVAVEPAVPGSVRVWDPLCYRCFFKMRYPECGLHCAAAIRDVIETEGPETVAAVFVEPIVGTNGLIVPPDGYMQELRAICDDYGILLVFDEVMTGFGRTGEWFAADLFGVAPDVMTLSKGINSGALPIGVVMVHDRIAAHFDDHLLYVGETQNGNPVACASAIAAIEVCQEENLIKNARELGSYLAERLADLKSKHPCVGEARGKGLFWGLDLVADPQTRRPLVPWTVENFENPPAAMRKLMNRLLEEGLFTTARWSVVMISPPLSITRDELDWGLETLDKALVVADDLIP